METVVVHDSAFLWEMISPLIHLANVTYRLPQKEHATLEEISLVLRRQEIMTLIGPNGAGKTTLVRLILGLIKPTTGEISRQKNLRIAYMPQKLSLSPFLPLDVRSFLMLSLFKSDMISPDIERFGVSKLLNTPCYQLSGGEWQRVLFTRAILKKPDLLILDEPSQGVDIFGQQDMYHRLSELKTDMSIFIVSHDLNFVLKTSDAVLCLNRHICCSGTPSHVAQSKAYQQLFPDIGFYRHEHTHRHE